MYFVKITDTNGISYTSTFEADEYPKSGVVIKVKVINRRKEV
jgi:hypothetical protein